MRASEWWPLTQVGAHLGLGLSAGTEVPILGLLEATGLEMLHLQGMCCGLLRQRMAACTHATPRYNRIPVSKGCSSGRESGMHRFLLLGLHHGCMQDDGYAGTLSNKRHWNDAGELGRDTDPLEPGKVRQLVWLVPAPR